MTQDPRAPCGLPPLRIPPPSRAEDQHWLVRRTTIRNLWILGILLLAGLTVLGERLEQHPHFPIENMAGFWSGYGFFACMGMVIFAKVLGAFLKRPDTYYDDGRDRP